MTVVPMSILIRTTRVDKDSYPHNRNVTDVLFGLIKLCFAFIIVNFSTYNIMCLTVIHVENYLL